MLTYSALKPANALKSGQPYSCYGIVGDGFLQQRVLNFLLEQILPEGEREFNQDILDGESATVNELLSKTGQLPFIATHRVVVLRNADKLEGVARAAAGEGKKKSGKTSKSQSPGQQLAEGLKNLPASTVMILMRSAETPESGFKAGSVRCLNANLDKIIETNGVIINCLITKRDQAAVIKIIREEAAKFQVQLDQGAAVHLATRVGNDIGLLLIELEKCALRAGSGGTVTNVIIDEMTRRKPQDTVFDLLDAIGTRQTPRALAMMRELLDGGEVPERFLALLVSHLRRLWQVRALRDQKVPLNAAAMAKISPALAAQFPEDGIVERFSAFSWKIRELQAQADRFSQYQIQSALERVLETDLALKGIEDDGGTPELLLERLVMRLGE